jgi:hypothetical protein
MIKPRIHLRAASIAFGVMLAVCAPASQARASGTVVVQHTPGERTQYSRVHFSIGKYTLKITSPDGKGVLVISLIGCEKAGNVHRCLPGGAEYRENGAARALNITGGTLYFNMTKHEQHLALSSTQVAAGGVVFAFHTAHNTFVSGSATIDGLNN